jgi:two-component system, sensor histidine kinase ChiS
VLIPIASNAFLLCGLLFLTLLVLPSCTPQALPAQPKVKEGVLDLRDWKLTENGPVKLDGDWRFYWNASRSSLGETKEFLQVPGSWTQANHPVKGKAVFQLRILTTPGEHLYGLKLYELPQSYRLYINEVLLLENRDVRLSLV